jgi:hypothetical protein
MRAGIIVYQAPEPIKAPEKNPLCKSVSEMPVTLKDGTVGMCDWPFLCKCLVHRLSPIAVRYTGEVTAGGRVKHGETEGEYDVSKCGVCGAAAVAFHVVLFLLLLVVVVAAALAQRPLCTLARTGTSRCRLFHRSVQAPLRRPVGAGLPQVGLSLRCVHLHRAHCSISIFLMSSFSY